MLLGLEDWSGVLEKLYETRPSETLANLVSPAPNLVPYAIQCRLRP